MADKRIPRKNQIAMAEPFGVIAAVATFGPASRGSNPALLIDSESVLDALVRGYSNKEDICDLVAIFWEMIRDWEIQVHLDRVPTDANMADGLSRGRLRIAQRRGWAFVRAVVPRRFFDGP